MNRLINRLIPIIGLLALASFTTDALASFPVTVSYAPVGGGGAGGAPGALGAGGPAEQIPALGTYALVVLSFLLAIVSVRVIRSGGAKRGKQLAVLAFSSALLAATGGGNLVNRAVAGIFTPIPLTMASGGQVSANPGVSEITNTSNVRLGITDIVINFGGCYVYYGANGGFNGGAVLMPPNNGGNGGGPISTCNDDPSTELDPQESCVLNVVCPLPV